MSSKSLLALGAGWVVLTVLVALVIYSSAGTLWIAAHDADLAAIVWPTLAVVLVAGLGLLGVVHAHLRLVLPTTAEE